MPFHHTDIVESFKEVTSPTCRDGEWKEHHVLVSIVLLSDAVSIECVCIMCPLLKVDDS